MNENGTKKRGDATVAAVIALLAELYPKCFSVYEGRRRPLKLPHTPSFQPHLRHDCSKWA